MKHFILFFFLSLSFPLFGQYDIKFKLDNYENDTIIIGNYYADKQLVHDTLISEGNGKFAMQGTDTLKSGVYFLLTLPKKNHIQFFVNGLDNEFEVEWNVNDNSDVKVKGSKDNEMFLKYVDFLATQRPKADEYSKRLTIADSTGVEDKEAKYKLMEVE